MHITKESLLVNEVSIIKQVRDFGYCELMIAGTKRVIRNQRDYEQLVKELES